MSKIHRENLLFKWMTRNYEITFGFKKVPHERCTKCGRPVPRGSNLCDDCFEEMKKYSSK
jgi:hypothetical protein